MSAQHSARRYSVRRGDLTTILLVILALLIELPLLVIVMMFWSFGW